MICRRNPHGTSITLQIHLRSGGLLLLSLSLWTVVVWKETAFDPSLCGDGQP
jgi:hypothetical protein